MFFLYCVVFMMDYVIFVIGEFMCICLRLVIDYKVIFIGLKLKLKI